MTGRKFSTAALRWQFGIQTTGIAIKKQRVHCPRALAQSPKELILDEPTSSTSLMRFSSLPITSVLALHGLNHAAMFCEELIGRIVASGDPETRRTMDILASLCQSSLFAGEQWGTRD